MLINFISGGMGRLSMCMTKLKDAVHSQKSKNVEVLQLAERVTQCMQGMSTATSELKVRRLFILFTVSLSEKMHRPLMP